MSKQTKPFTHVPQGAETYGKQKTFLGDGPNEHVQFTITRMTYNNFAVLTNITFGKHSQVSQSVGITPEFCEELARALIDTAHDLRTNPAQPVEKAA